MKFDLMSPGYIGKSSNIDASRLVNFYLEMSSKESKAIASLIGTPGTRLWANLGMYPVRGWRVFNNTLYVVVGNTLYSLDINGNVTGTLGTLVTTTSPVIMKDNGIAASGVGGNQLMIIDGTTGYIYNVLTKLFVNSGSFTGGGFPTTGLSGLEYIDGYFVGIQPNSMYAVCSDLYDGINWTTLAIAAVEGTSDNIQAVWQEQEQLFFIKWNSTEIWYDSGVDTGQGFPFSRMTSAVLDIGTPAPFSVVRGTNGLYMLGTRRSGDISNFIGVVRITNDTPEVICPPAIVYQMRSWAPFTDVVGYFYEQDGHGFYVVTSPSANSTFVYDASIQDPMAAWHERSTYVSGSPYQVNRHISNFYTYFNSQHLVSDYQNGNIYVLSSTIYKDHDLPIVAFRTAEILSDDKGDLNSITIHRFQVDAEMGVGGSIALSFSSDGGHTWSSDYAVTLGQIGQYGGRAVWRRVGTFPYGMIPRVAISDNCKRVIINGYVS